MAAFQQRRSGAAYAQADKEEKLAAGKPLQPPDPEVVKVEALKLAMDEGLTLLRANNMSGYKGVTKEKSGRYRNPFAVQICVGGGYKHLGHFATVEEAALAYARADREKKLAAGQPLQAPDPAS